MFDVPLSSRTENAHALRSKSLLLKRLKYLFSLLNYAQYYVADVRLKMQLLVPKLLLKFSHILISNEQYSVDPWLIATIILFCHNVFFYLYIRAGALRPEMAP